VSQGDDELDITSENPSARSTDNIITLLGSYNIDDNAAEHIYDGSIIQNNGDDIYDGIVNFGNPDVQIQIIQNGQVLSDDWWNFSGAGLNPDPVQGISHRFMLKTRTSGSDIDGRKLIGISRVFNKTYSEFPINGTVRGNNVLALSNTDDLNNTTLLATVATWSDVVNNSEGYSGADVDNNGSDEFYYSLWDKASRSINQFYERMKYLTRDGSSEILYGLSGELFRGITHEIPVDTASGSFSSFEAVSWSGGTGQMLAINSPTAGTAMWIQLLTGSVPTDGQVITGGGSGATVAVNGSAVERPVAKPFVGASTGSAIIGAYGLGLEPTTLTNSDQVFDLTNSPVQPPNFVTFSVGGLVAGEDRVHVTPWDGSSTDTEGNPAIDKDQFSINGALTTNNITSVTISSAIPTDTPNDGYLRVEDNNGVYRRLHYSAYSGSTFTIDTVDGNEDFASVQASSGNNAYLAYIDTTASSSTESFTGVYSGDRGLVVLVRDGGGTPIKQFISSATFGSSNSSITAIRTSDS
jgi:hypothetical protein